MRTIVAPVDPYMRAVSSLVQSEAVDRRRLSASADASPETPPIVNAGWSTPSSSLVRDLGRGSARHADRDLPAHRIVIPPTRSSSASRRRRTSCRFLRELGCGAFRMCRYGLSIHQPAPPALMAYTGSFGARAARAMSGTMGRWRAFFSLEIDRTATKIYQTR